MALFTRRSKTPSPKTCEHTFRDPRWDSMDDAGIKERIDHYLCRDCGQKLGRPADDDEPP